MSIPQWSFRRHQPDDITHNPLTGEHFSDGDGDWKPGESLVRECIQNSLDAAISEKRPVFVRFQLSPRNAMNDDVASYWFDSLWEHLCAKDDRGDRVIRDLPGDRPCAGEFIVVEDFGTRGLEGDITQSGLSGEKNENRFFNFFRAEGLTGNAADATSGGSWGAGKSVFNRCSRINSFLALSTRESSRDTVLMGKAVLREHLIDGVQYKAFGLFGSKSADDRLVLPIQDPRQIARFARDFRISRDPESEDPAPGLSVVIPYPDPEITSDGIVEIVIRQYFYPILSGRLAARIVDGGADSSDPIDINEGTIFDIAEQNQKPEILGLLRLSQWSMDPESREQAYELERPSSGEAPLWDDARLRPDDPAYTDLCRRFEAGDPVAFRIPMTIYPTDGQPEQAYFFVYLQRDEEGTGYRPVFVRDKIVVPNARQRGIRGHRVFALVTIDAGPLAILLKAAEPPAHTYWDHNTANFKGRYEYGKQIIDYVVHAPRNLVNAISSRDTEPDFDTLADLFPAPDPEGKPKENGKRRKGRRKSPTGPVDPPKSSPPAYRVDKLESGGFAIVRANSDKTDLPPLVRVRLGYATSKGDPIKKYHPADFDLSELSVISQSCRVIERSHNILRFEPLSENFRIEVTGFDTNRELCIKPRVEHYPKGVEA